MKEQKDFLRVQTMRRYALLVLMQGAHRMIHRKQIMTAFLLAFILVVAAAIWAGYQPIGVFAAPSLLVPLYLIIAILILVALLYIVGMIPGGWSWYQDFIRIGFCNSTGEAPFPLRKAKSTLPGVRAVVFQGKGFPLEIWEQFRAKIEAARNIYIVAIYPESPSTTRLEYVPAHRILLGKIYWEPHFLSKDDFVIVLGEAVWGPVQIDLSKTPHWLIAGATGMGKSILLRLILRQCLAKGAHVYLADWKGGIDYTVDLRNECHIILNEDTLIRYLNTMTEELHRRKELFTLDGCANISEYNKKHANSALCRQILVLDETSMILDPTGRSKGDKDKISEILQGLLTIGRLGRAFGLHLICATQRPDVGSVPGPLKAQLDGRLCAHTADAQSSMVIMDDSSASKLPAIPGRFILRDGSGIDKTFQVYFCD